MTRDEQLANAEDIAFAYLDYEMKRLDMQRAKKDLWALLDNYIEEMDAEGTLKDVFISSDYCMKLGQGAVRATTNENPAYLQEVFVDIKLKTEYFDQDDFMGSFEKWKELKEQGLTGNPVKDQAITLARSGG